MMITSFDNAAKFLRLLTQRRSAYPQEIQVEVTNACNLRCAMCPHTHGSIPAKDFPVELFENMVRNNLAPMRLVLTGWGEPLMHRCFFKLIEIANRHWPDTRIRFTTNGILLDDERRSRMASLRVSGVTVSVDLWPERSALPPEWRDVLHPPSSKAFQNLLRYSEDRNVSMRSPLIMQCLLLRENFEDVRKFVDFAAKHKLSAMNLVRMQSYPEYPIQRPAWQEEQRMISELIQLGKDRGVSVRSVNRQSILLRTTTHFDRVCLRTDDSVYITVDGSITPCCNLRDYTIGSLSVSNSTSTIQDAWKSTSECNFFSNQSPICGKCDALFHSYRS